jgi:hypothetical protein
MKTSLQFFQSIPLVLVLSALGCRAPQPSRSAAPTVMAASSGETKAPAAYDTAPDSLVSLNQLFLQSYRERQATVRTNVSPLIVASFSNLELYWHGVAETNRCIPDIYHSLKAVAHVPFGIYLRVEPFSSEANVQIPGDPLQALRAYQAAIESASASMSKAGFSEVQLIRQKQILAASLDYLSNVLATARAPLGELMAFARHVGPWLLENANDAAAAQLEMTHAAVTSWKKRIPPDEWKRLVVVVRGPQMPRRMNILTQYFAKVLDEPSHKLGYPLESRRLIYAEFIPQSRDYLDLMATTFIDGEASEAFFGDRWRMSRDLLADGAEEYLKTISFDR